MTSVKSVWYASLIATSVSSALAAAAEPTKVAITCQFSKYTNGIGVNGTSATLQLTQGTEDGKTLILGDYKVELDAYWLKSGSFAEGLNVNSQQANGYQ